MLLCYYFLWFVFYSFIGWLYESTICSILKEHKFINRGYLLGPYCPIYGVGAIVNFLILKDINNAIAIFFISMITCSIVEYFVSYSMEKLFHARWWDYSEYPLNINGRICLYGCLIFASACTAVMKLLQPNVENFTKSLPDAIVISLSIVICILIIIDSIFTTIHLTKFNTKVKEIQFNISEYIISSLENITEEKNELKENFNQHIKENINQHLTSITESTQEFKNSLNQRLDSITESKEEFKNNLNQRLDSIAENKEEFKENLKELKNCMPSLNLVKLKNRFKNSELRILSAFPKYKSTNYDSLVEKIKESISSKK